MRAAPRTLSNTVATINLASLRHNVSVLRGRANELDLMGVVKADAYGHGAVRVSEILLSCGIRRLAVATVPEAVELRRAGISEPILVFAPPFAVQAPLYAEYDLEAVIDSSDTAETLARSSSSTENPVKCHVEVDTGMTRIGVSASDLVSTVGCVERRPELRLAGIMTHLARAEHPETGTTSRQLDRLEDALDGFVELPAPLHVSNSAALFDESIRHRRIASHPITGARVGIGLYGLLDLPDARADEVLQPVMTLKSRVLAVHSVDAGVAVSYGGTWSSSRRTRIATIGAGYADGYPRIVSNRARVRIGDREYPVVGRVCMDLTMVDIGPGCDDPGCGDPGSGEPGSKWPDDDIRPGDEVILFGRNSPTCFDMATWAQTITYEITCGINKRVPREYTDVRNG